MIKSNTVYSFNLKNWLRRRPISTVYSRIKYTLLHWEYIVIVTKLIILKQQLKYGI